MRDELTSRGIENFVPSVTRAKTRGKGTVEMAVLPNLVFLRMNRDDAFALVNNGGVQLKYLTDCATHKAMVVPDKQMDDFRRVFDASVDEGGLVREPLNLGDRVRVVKGPLNGVEGFVLELQGEFFVVVGLIGMLYAKARVPRAWLEKA